MKLYVSSVLAVLSALMFGTSTAAVAAPASAVASGAKASPSEFKQIPWEDLIPKDWDPYKGLNDKNVGMLNDGTVQAMQLMRDLRQVWDNAPANAAMDGAAVKLPGYVVPLEETKAGLKEFLLVPYFGACIHSPPPPANQIIHVFATKPAKGFRAMDAVWVSGVLKAFRQDSYMGMSGYTMDAAAVDRYVPPAK